MATGEDWQCRKCGDQPSAFSGGIPSPARCRAGGSHVWTKYPYTSGTRSDDWQCFYCGKRPTSWTTCGGKGSHPSDNTKCPQTGFKHVYELL